MALHPAGRPAGLAPAAPATDAADGHTVAVTARSVLSAAASLRLRLDHAAVDLIGSHAVLPDGTVVLAVDAMTRTGGLLVAARGRPGAVRLDVTQLVPIAVRARVRARVRVLGTARRFDPASLDSCDADTVMSLLDLPAVALWAVEPVEIGLTGDQGGVTVDINAYRAARPDPLAATEAVHLQHLAQRHNDVLDELATLLDPALTARSTRVPLVAVDAEGVVLRAETSHGHTDVRLPFARRLTGSADLADGLCTLLAVADEPRFAPSSRLTADPQRPPATACDCGLPAR